MDYENISITRYYKNGKDRATLSFPEATSGIDLSVEEMGKLAESIRAVVGEGDFYLDKGHLMTRINNGTAENPPCRIKVEDELVLAGDHQAAAGVLHEINELIHQRIVDGSLRLIRVSGVDRHRRKPELPLTAVASSLDSVEGRGRIYLNIATLVPLPVAHGDHIPSQEGSLDGVQCRGQHGVGELNSGFRDGNDQMTHAQDSTGRNTP